MAYIYGSTVSSQSHSPSLSASLSSSLCCGLHIPSFFYGDATLAGRAHLRVEDYLPPSAPVVVGRGIAPAVCLVLFLVVLVLRCLLSFHASFLFPIVACVSTTASRPTSAFPARQYLTLSTPFSYLVSR